MSDDGLKVTIHRTAFDEAYRVTLSDGSRQFLRYKDALTLWGAKLVAWWMLRRERRFRTKRSEWTYQ